MKIYNYKSVDLFQCSPFLSPAMKTVQKRNHFNTFYRQSSHPNPFTCHFNHFSRQQTDDFPQQDILSAIGSTMSQLTYLDK